MNKTAIKNFAVWAREKLIADIKYKASMLGITEEGIADKLPQSTNDLHFYNIGTKDYVEISGKEIAQRSALVSAIKQKEKDVQNYTDAFQYVVEEVAYTWFNRLIAIRFMEVNDYLPSGIRVLSSENKAKKEPDFVTNPFDTDLGFSFDEQDIILQLKDENELDKLFRMLFIKQCNKLHDILPELFEETDNYSELLLTISFTDKDGVVYRLVHDIDEDDFNVEKEGQVEIIGWMYQYYNIEPKAAVFARAKGEKITKDKIPAATQLFTPDWIVRYMVENSLGRIWVEGHPNDSLRNSWKYYIDETEQEAQVKTKLDEIKATYKNLTPEAIKLIDPCMGSGHILVYAFDVLMQIYECYGYTQRDATRSILTNNIYGTDIDKRAYQIAYFAVMMKARQYNRRILKEEIKPNLCFTKSSKTLSEHTLAKMGDCRSITQKLVKELSNASEYGSVMSLSLSEGDLQKISSQIEYVEDHRDEGDLFDVMAYHELAVVLKPIVMQATLLVQKYDIVVTNPPYMPVSNAGAKLSDYVKKNYPDSKTDLFAVFIERCQKMLKINGYQAMITMHSWMFLSSYEKLRENLLGINIVNMAHLGARAFEEIGGEIVQTTSFVMRKSRITDYKGTYCRLIEPTSQQGKEDMFLDGKNRFYVGSTLFEKIPNRTISYWLSDSIVQNFVKKNKVHINCYTGLICGDNSKYIRSWFEVSFLDIDFVAESVQIDIRKKYVPYNHGGTRIRWYGGHNDVVFFQNNAFAMRHEKNAVFRNESSYFKGGITWNRVSNLNPFIARSAAKHFAFDDVSPTGISEDNLYTLGFFNSKVFNTYLSLYTGGFKVEIGQIGNVPIVKSKQTDIVDMLVKNCIDFSHCDWDAFETSWDFKKHPLLCYETDKASIAFEIWTKECDERFHQLKGNEEELNRIFIEIYGLQDELTPEVEDKDITVRKADLQRDIKSLISYAVGCMFGRYSLDEEGLAYAGGEWNNSKYKTFIPDEDNCIPITDEEYFEDDIVGLFCAWLKKVYGENTLEENLDFIANALGNKGKTSREVIRNYFLTDFIKDHIKTYQKRPIYWLFDSGKQNGFKALIYMHRWNADTIGNVRVEYLHRIQRVYEKEIIRMQEIIDNSHDNKEISSATKRKEKLQKQIKETKDYDAKIAHLALSRIDIDLDDGVKVNYEKVQTVDGEKMQILAKI